MQCPNKHASDEGALRFSQRVVSLLRKDVEGTFGKTKKRWHILKNPMLLQSKARIDNFVFTCAILHNMLLDNEEWNDEDDNYYHICADAGGNVMDQRVVNLRYGLVDSRYLGEEIRL